jgi:hypothetical protein
MRCIIDPFRRVRGGFLKRGFDHPQRAQTRFFFGLHGRYHVLLNLIDDWHAFDILKNHPFPCTSVSNDC